MGLRLRIVGDCGAYAGFGGSLALGPTYLMAHGPYVIPQLRYDAIAALTNTAPVGAFRGAGRPEAAALLERLLDVAADELGLAPEEIRRRNLIAADAFPYATSTGATYDVGDFDLPLDEALRIADVDGARARAAPAARGRGDPAPGDRHLDVRRGHRLRRLGVRLGGGPRRRQRHGDGGHLGARAGACDVVLDARRRPARHPPGADQLPAVRHRPGAQRRRDRWVTLAPARWQRGPRGRVGGPRPSGRAGRADARGRPGRRPSRRGRVRRRGRPRTRRRVAEPWRRTPRSRGSHWPPTSTSGWRARRSRSGPT